MTYKKHVAVGELYEKYKKRYDELMDIDKKIKTLELELNILTNVNESETSNNNFLKDTIKELQSELKSLRDYMGEGRMHLELKTLPKIMEETKLQIK